MARERVYDYPVTEYARAIHLLGWNQVEASRKLGIDPRTSRRYAAGDLEPPAPLAMLLRLLVFLVRDMKYGEKEMLEQITTKLR